MACALNDTGIASIVSALGEGREMRSSIIAAGCLALTACASVDPVFDFSAPAVTSPPADLSSVTLTAWLSARQTEYQDGSVAMTRGATNIFDEPVMHAASAGLGAAIFGATDDTAKIAGWFGATMLGRRTYYRPNERAAALRAAAEATGCLTQQARELRGLDGTLRRWATLQAAAQGNVGATRDAMNSEGAAWGSISALELTTQAAASDFRGEVLRVAPLALTAYGRIIDSARDIDLIRIDRTGSGALPSVASMMEVYRREAQAATQQATANATLAQNLAGAKALDERSVFDREATALLGQDLLIRDLAALGEDVSRCVQFASG